MTNNESSRNCLRRIINDDQEFSNQSIINVIEKFVKSVNVMEETILVPSRLLDRQVGDSSDESVAAEKSHNHNHSHHHHHNHHHHHHHNKKKSTNIRDHLQNTDLFNLYSMLNSVKTDLLWGRNNEQEDEMTEVTLREQNYDNSTMAGVETETASNNKNETQAQPQQQLNTEGNAPTQTKGHVRRPSTVSVASSNSSTSTISDSESEVSSNENDSGIESENQKEKDRSLEVARQFRTHLLGLYKSLEQMTEAASYLTARYQSDMGGC